MNFISFVKMIYPEFEINWHHQIICNKMEKWANSSDGKLIVLTPPRSSKTTLASILLPAYMAHMNINQDNKTSIITYSSSLADHNKRKFNKIIESNTNRDNFRFGHVGQITSSQITAGIIDDPNYSFNKPSENEKIWNWYQSEYRTRFKCPEKTLLICTSSPGCLAKQIITDARKTKTIWDIVRIKAYFDPVTFKSNECPPFYWDGQQPALINPICDLPHEIFGTVYQQNVM